MRTFIAYFILAALAGVVFFILTLPRRKELPPKPARGRVCRHCKGDNAPDARYCGRCGERLDAGS